MRKADNSKRISIRRKLNRTNGVVLYYTTVIMLLMFGFCSFAVDLGRVQLAKTELRRAADSAARAAAAELPDTNSAIAFAKQYAQVNTVDGTAVVMDTTKDIEFGKWSSSTGTFKKLAGFDVTTANCVHISLHRTAARGTAVPLLFAKLLGQSYCDVNGESYVMIIPGVNVDQHVPGTANPFLSGALPGTVVSRNNPHNNPDYAGTTSSPRQSPLAVGMGISEGEGLTFDSIDGDVRHDPGMAYYSPDGQLTDIGHNINTTDSLQAQNKNNYYNENGIADVTAPINALVGIFMDDSAPSNSAAPKNLDFSTDASRDFTTLKPELKQIFFIGDGLNSSGAQQQFIAPKGATRLFLATWDYYEWNNNAGSREIVVKRPMKIITVK